MVILPSFLAHSHTLSAAVGCEALPGLIATLRLHGTRAPPDSITASRAVPKELIWDIRVRELVAVLREAPWASGFTIWNAGKEGRRLYRSLPPELQVNVRAFCDVDPGKIEQAREPVCPVQP